jgi:RNA polymerase sigma-70 factor, ECF subfamily
MDESMRKGGQAEAFEHYRVLLFSIAYRMTGSACDAEDLVQETYLRYQASESSEIISLKAYLTTIITHLALDYLKSAHVVREQYMGTWLPEPILTSEGGGFPLANLEHQESLSLAFLRLLEALSPPERAVFLLHEIFDYPFSEIGSMLSKSPANCRQIFHRARQALQDKRARFEPEPQHQRQLLLSFLSASQAGDMATLTSLLAQDAISWSDGGGTRVSELLQHGEDIEGIRLADGRNIAARAVILATTPTEALKLLNGEYYASLRQSIAATQPVRVACLDVALSRLPATEHAIVFDVEQPRFLTAQSLFARVAPEGGALIHTFKQLDPAEPGDPRQDEHDLEEWLDQVQPGWRSVLVKRISLPRIEAISLLPTAQSGGLAGRPGVQVPGVHNLSLAGDWIGNAGYLADASLASARQAAQLLQ